MIRSSSTQLGTDPAKWKRRPMILALLAAAAVFPIAFVPSYLASLAVCGYAVT